MKLQTAALLLLAAAAGPAPAQTLARSESMQAARVEEAEVVLWQGAVLAASVHASGMLSAPCALLATPQVQRRGREFRLLLAEAGSAPELRCNTLTGTTTPFAVSVPLDIEGLAAGSYRVHVNDLVLDFVLGQDQP